MHGQKTYWVILLPMAAAKLLFHLFFVERYGFQRDEFLYMALGNHPALGYWSNPPFIGWVSWLVQQTLGDALWAIRLPAVLTGCGLLLLTGMMASELGGGRYAQALAGLAGFISPAYLRSAHMLQPVIFDFLFWTGMIYALLRFLNRRDDRSILLFGILFGIGFLNKYMVGFLLVGLLPILLVSSLREVFTRRATLLAAGIALLLMLPNLIWQISHHFPVVKHMRELAESQLGNVEPANFLLDQFFINGTTFLLWIPGLLWLLTARPAHPYRPLGWLYLVIMALFLALSGKSYYTLGLYPVLIAAGATAWAQWLQPVWSRVLLPAVMILLFLPLLPMGLPVLPLNRFVDYCQTLVEQYHFEGPMRWEDGEIHPLPQDFADMLGWEEMARLAEKAYAKADEPVLLYAENYGQAGSIDRFGRGLPPVVSFSDSYRLWAPDSTEAQALIYVNSELGEDVEELFADIQLVGTIQTPYAREYGAQVYLCRKPRRPFGELWAMRAREVKGKSEVGNRKSEVRSGK